MQQKSGINWFWIVSLLLLIILIILGYRIRGLSINFGPVSVDIERPSPTSNAIPYKIISTATEKIIKATEPISPKWTGILTVRRPYLNEIRENMLSIWDANLLNINDIRFPNINSYRGEAKVEQEYLWTWHWCTTTDELLKNNRLYLTVRFYVNGEVLSNDENGQVLPYDYSQVPTNIPCTYWSTVVGGWRKNESYELKIIYTFTEDVYDGSNTYPRGEYGHVLIVTAR